MTGPSNHDPETAALAAAFVLDALGPSEQAAARARLESDPAFAQLVADLRNRDAASDAAPSGSVWTRIETALRALPRRR